MLPISVVEGKGFIALCYVMLGPNFKVPSRYNIMKYLRQMKEQGTGWLKKKFEQIEFVNLTTDGWTSRAQHSYMTTTCHYITVGWVLVSHVLYTAEFPKKHTAINLSGDLETHARRWGIDGKILSTTHDNARNITAAVKKSRILGESNPCFAHTQNLCIKEVFKIMQVKNLLKRCRKLVGFFKHSTRANEGLKSQQKSEGEDVMKLIQHCVTRWNSCHDMLKRLLDQRVAICAVLYDRDYVTMKRCEKLDLENKEWIMVEELVRILEPFAATLQELCADKSVTISAVRSNVYYLLTEVKPNGQRDSEFAAKIKSTLLTELSTRFNMHPSWLPTPEPASLNYNANDNTGTSTPQASSTVNARSITDMLNDSDDDSEAESVLISDSESESESDSEGQDVAEKSSVELEENEADKDNDDANSKPSVAQISSLLDPRYKKLACETPEDANRIKNHLKELFNNVILAENRDRDKTNRRNLSNQLREKVAEALGLVRSTRSEYEKYLDEEEIGFDEDPLEWWKNNESRFPKIAVLARRYLSIPASSAPSERVFSTAGHIVNVKRTSLLPENVDMLVFLNKNPCSIQHLQDLYADDSH